MRVPLAIFTSPVTQWVLPGFFHQLQKHGTTEDNDIRGWCRPIVFGYNEINPNLIPRWAWDDFISLGPFEHYPSRKWSDAFIKALAILRDMNYDAFWFMLDDYWIIRDIDIRGMMILWQELTKRKDNILRIDLTFERLYSEPGKWDFYANQYGVFGHLDIIKAESPNYFMSLWGSMMSVQAVANIILPDQTPQEIELQNYSDVYEVYSVLGTRQAPLLHTNICHKGKFFNFAYGLLDLSTNDMKELRELGYTNGL